MKIALAILAILLVIGLLLGSSFVSRRNQMAIKREAVNAAWSQVDVVLQRRADLIPNLVETVKGYAAQEVTVFGDIAKARSALLSASTPTDKIAANQRLDSALGRLLVVVENYPQLKSNENFLRLQDELVRTFCAFKTNWPARRTESRWSGAVTMRRCKTTTRIFLFSRITWWRA